MFGGLEAASTLLTELRACLEDKASSMFKFLLRLLLLALGVWATYSSAVALLTGAAGWNVASSAKQIFS